MAKSLKLFFKKLFGLASKSKPVIMPFTNISSDTIIGDYTYIGYNCNITKSKIGRYCSIANNVTIGAGEHLINEVSTSSLFYENAYETLTNASCVIQNDVWIGVNSVIRRGVNIGNGAIIGANSFVNKDVPAYAIVVGSPAKILKYRFEDDKIHFLTQSKWWEMKIEEARRFIKNLNENKI
jgi:virginiamycin A acetyltransferase